MRHADVEWVESRLQSIGYDAYDQTVPATPAREYVVVYPGESRSPVERAGQVHLRERQVWRLVCVSRSLAVLRRMVPAVTVLFTGARFGGVSGPVIVEDEIGPELSEGSDADRRYSQTVIYHHYQSKRNPS